jgi:hypothetical protein
VEEIVEARGVLGDELVELAKVSQQLFFDVRGCAKRPDHSGGRPARTKSHRFHELCFQITKIQRGEPGQDRALTENKFRAEDEEN